MENRWRADSPEEQGLRQRWEGAIILAAALGVLLLVILQTRIPQLSNSHTLASNVTFVLLINVNIILLVLLVFLVGRNLFKLIYERRRNLLGSHLRFRLVLAFVAISLFPAVLLLLTGAGFMMRSIESWFADQVQGALDGSLYVARTYYDRVADDAVLHAGSIAAEIAESGLLDRRRQRGLHDVLEGKRRAFNLGRIQVLTGDGALMGSAVSSEVPAPQSITSGVPVVRILHNDQARYIRQVAGREIVCGLAPINVNGLVVGAVEVAYLVPPSVTRTSAQVVDTFREYRHLKILKQPIKNNYVIAMFLVTAVAVFSAIWIGLFLAKKIAIPLQELAAGTREVAQGHWAYRIEGEGRDEIGTLVAAFNRMTGELQHSHHELDARRRYMEILLANINAGVVSLDRSGLVTTVNRAAEQLLGLCADEAYGCDYCAVFPFPECAEVRRIVRDLLPLRPAPSEEGARQSQGQLKLDRDGQVLSLLVTGTPLTDDRGEVLGVMCFFEDVTQIVRVERMEAWREVACRIAHEIKNPLTPIQLAAQRLHRRFAPQIERDPEVFDECVRSIGLEVEAIKTLVNEFSTFARLPTAEHKPEDLNALAQEAFVLFAEAHRDLQFIFAPDAGLPRLDLDREGIKRALRNLLDNAVAACQGCANGIPSRIEVTTRYLRSLGIARLEVADTGCGISPEEKAHLFEPYFSTKKDGTGLGLAIVATVVADHQAFIRVRDNEPRGSRFIIELPVRRGERRAADGVDRATAALVAPGARRSENRL
jgi:two-component system, NtrC family, nitrogen regulation sensor histidine kinase NtrY